MTSSRKEFILWICMYNHALFLCCWLNLVVAGVNTNTSNVTVVNVGVVVDSTTRMGKEQKVGMEVAAQDFNDSSKDFKISLHFRMSNSMDPLQAAYSAKELVEENRVEAIVGSASWQEASLVGEIGNEAKVPILSLMSTPLNSLSSTNQWPYLVKIDSNYTSQIRCIASLVMHHQWRKVVAIYEDDGYDSGTSFMLDQLSVALQQVGSMIEYQLALPPMALMTNPKENITLQLIKVLSRQSRVFIVLYSSLPVAIHLFEEAKNMGLVGRQTAWIVTTSVGDLIDSINSSSIKYMEGILGVKTYFDEYSKTFKDFHNKFLLNFLSQYPDEDTFHPSVHALRAYDAITTITKAIKPSIPISLEGILSSNFIGLSGRISMKNDELGEDIKLFRILNIVGKKYKELDFWSSRLGFFKSISNKKHEANDSYTETFHGKVNWPGDIDHVPKGWEMPTNAKLLKIGVPKTATFLDFVKVENVSKLNGTIFSGFCIDMFLEVVKIIEERYAVPYEFEAFNGTYDELIDSVYNKTYDAAVGDFTILENRSKKVEFTQPYTRSGLRMIVPLTSKESQKAWMFLKPFSWQMWLVSIGTLLYTVVIVSLLERRNNLDHEGSANMGQLGVALWFTVTSIFFAHRENVTSNNTRITVAVWLFLVFMLTSSYTASLTSMLTVPLMEPNVKDIKQLIESEAKIGYDEPSFTREYLVSELKFKQENIILVDSQYSYGEFFDNGRIQAAFLESPYAEKVFLREYCKSFTQTTDRFKLLGQGFVFQKGSPLAVDVSKAILRLSEKGILKQLDDKWFTPTRECSITSTQSDHNVERLNIQGFWVLYLFSGIVSTICFLIFIARLLMDFRRYGNQGLSTDVEDPSVWNRIVRLALYFDNDHNQSVTTPERPLVGAASSDPNTPSDNGIVVSWDDELTTTPSRTPTHRRSPALEMSSSFVHRL